MTLDEQRRMALLEATLREVRSIADAAKSDNTCVPPEDAYYGQVLQRWKRVRRQMNSLLQP